MNFFSKNLEYLRTKKGMTKKPSHFFMSLTPYLKKISFTDLFKQIRKESNKSNYIYKS